MVDGVRVVSGDSGFLEDIRGKDFVFVLVLGTTDTSLIPGITIAGASPELTHYTPPADAEYLVLGRCRVIPGIPVTPDGIPTPAVITRAAVKLAGAPVLVVDAGLRVKPLIPYVDVGGRPGGDIRSGSAVPLEVVEEVFYRSKLLGEQLAKLGRVIVVGESIPAGTTTSLAVLVGLGYDAWNRVSSASPINPHGLKRRVVEEALRNAKLRSDMSPLELVSRIGDPIMPAITGIVIGAFEADRDSKIILAGGTQMASIVALLKEIKREVLGNTAIGTTRWIVEDRQSDLKGLVEEIDPSVPVYAVNLDFSRAPYPGLRKYEEGYVKEGVGAGGACLIALASGRVGLEELHNAIYEEYSRLVNAK